MADITNMTVYFCPGFHSDVVWLEDQRDYAEVLLGSAKQNLILCRHDPGYGVFLHELSYLKPYFDTELEDRDYIKKLIAGGRIGTGGSHSQPTETVVGPEGLIRNILYGRLYHERVLGDRPTVYMPWDVFGHVPQLSQILAKSRFDGCVWSKAIRGFHPIFWHMSPDGTKLLHRRVEYWWGTSGRNDLAKKMKEELPEMLDYGLNEDLRVEAVDFKPPTAWLAGRSRSLARRKPRILVSGKAHEQFFDVVLEKSAKGEIDLPVTARDSEYYHMGTRLSRIEFKIANRLGENAVLSAEKFATVASLLGAAYPDKALDKAWRQLLYCQHHDGIAGPLCDRAYVDFMTHYRDALELASEAYRNSLLYIGEAVDTHHAPEDAVPIAVFNPMSWKRTDVCRADIDLNGFMIVDTAGVEAPSQRTSDGRVEFVAADVPSLGYKTYYAVPVPSGPSEPEEEKGNEIENEFYRLSVRATQGGCITSLYDKIAGKELIDPSVGVGNELVVLSEKEDREEPPWEVFTEGVKFTSSSAKAKVSVERGPAASRIKVKTGGKYPYSQEITLYPGVRRIDFSLQLDDYKGKDELFAVTFPGVKGAAPIFEERMAAVTGKRSREKMKFQTWQWRNYSDSGLRSGYQWMESNWNVTVSSPDGRKMPVGVTSIVMPHDPGAVHSAYALQEALVKKGVTCTPVYDDFESSRREKLQAEWNTMPFSLGDDLPWGTSFVVILDVAGSNLQAGRLLAGLDAGVRERFEAEVKENGSSLLLLRDNDVPSGWPPLWTLIISAADGERLDKAVIGLCDQVANEDIRLSDSQIAAEIEPVDDRGLALINKGTVLYSTENDGTMVMFLMHTASWGYSAWGPDRLPFHLVPEWKTHRFEYALYPHEGNWRDAQTVRTGYDFNNPLEAVTLERNEGVLPPEKAFLEVDSDSVVVSTVKPKGNPAASLSFEEPDPASWITLRLYESAGRASVGAVRLFTGIYQASAANLLEERSTKLETAEESVEVELGPFSVETYELVPDRLPRKHAHKQLGRDREDLPVLHARYWQHNSGADPIGYCPISVTLSGDVRTGVHIGQGGVTINEVTVGVANNLTRGEMSGDVEILVPDGWRTVPEKVSYKLGPGQHKLRKVMLVFDRRRRHGIIKARVRYGGQVYQDILEVAKDHLLTMEASLASDGVDVLLRNPNDEAIEGAVALVTPLETWPRGAVDSLSLMETGPAIQGFELGPKSEETLKFRVSGSEGVAWWGVAKLMYNGRVAYTQVMGDG